jgi:hypothetical protein
VRIGWPFRGKRAAEVQSIAPKIRTDGAPPPAGLAAPDYPRSGHLHLADGVHPAHRGFQRAARAPLQLSGESVARRRLVRSQRSGAALRLSAPAQRRNRVLDLFG